MRLSICERNYAFTGLLGMANALHRRPRHFLGRFVGVSARRFPHYLTWFEWAEQVRRSGPRPARVMSGQAAVGRYESTRAALTVAAQPFWEYWERRHPCQRWSNTK